MNLSAFPLCFAGTYVSTEGSNLRPREISVKKGSNLTDSRHQADFLQGKRESELALSQMG